MARCCDARRSCGQPEATTDGDRKKLISTNCSASRRDRRRQGAEGGLPQARHAVPPGPQSGRPHRRDQVQGSQRRLRVPEGPAEARRLRPLRPRRLRERRRRAGGFPGDFGASMSDIFDNIFGDMMGGRRGTSQSRGGRERGADLRYNMEITLEEAYNGKTAEIVVPTKITCKTCAGSGSKPGSSLKTCADLRRPRPRPRGAGLLLDRAHLPDLPGPRPGHLRPLPRMPRRRPRHRGAQALASTFPPASRTARASALPAKAKRACAAVRRATSTSSCRSSRTNSSSATAPTSSAACRSR